MSAEMEMTRRGGERPGEQLPVAEAELPVYRDRTLAMLRKYFRLAVEVGRLPSVLGREFFRARVTSYRVATFEDAVIFVHDVERCLEQLPESSRQLIARMALEEYTAPEAARLMRCPLRNIERRYPEALDELSAIFLRVRLLSLEEPRRRRRAQVEETPIAETTAETEEQVQAVQVKKSVARVFACQDVENRKIPGSLCGQGEYKFGKVGGIICEI